MLNNVIFEKELQTICENFREYKFLLAVSGGADSMVLAYLFKALNLDFQIAHINYKLRGKDSELDSELVDNFCKTNAIQFYQYQVSEKDQKPENSIQVWARNLRYRFFFKILNETKSDFIVTAHHLNDQLETFLINLSRGSGIRGLSGIPSNENSILRPLLNFSKEEIYDFAHHQNIEFREDLSNKKNDYLRNKIRNEIVPLLMETNDRFLLNFRNSIDYLSKTKNFVSKQISEKFEHLKIEDSDALILNKENFSNEDIFLKYEILSQFGFDSTTEIEKIFVAKTGSVFQNNRFQLIINRNELIFQPRQNNTVINEVIELAENDSSQIFIPFEILDQKEEINWNFDKTKLAFPLKLRHHKEGDSFSPKGMKGRKTVSKFFRDEKLSILAKSKTWLLCDANDVVLGIIPYRQDGRFASNEKTETIITVSNKK